MAEHLVHVRREPKGHSRSVFGTEKVHLHIAKMRIGHATSTNSLQGLQQSFIYFNIFLSESSLITSSNAVELLIFSISTNQIRFNHNRILYANLSLGSRTLMLLVIKIS